MACSGGVLKTGFLPSLPSVNGGGSSSKMLNTALAVNRKRFNGAIAAIASAATTRRQSTTQRPLNYWEESPYTGSILDKIDHLIHMKHFSVQELKKLAAELREEILYTESKSGGNRSSNLGMAELSVALQHVFDASVDKIIWDESPSDAFGVGHSSTSIFAGLGMAVGRDLIGKDNHVVSIIGDRAMIEGQAYEAMNNAGYLDSNLIIILNDNGQSTMGAPEASMFEQLGIHYIGPVDGHSVEDLVHVLNEVKSVPDHGAVLIHVVTKKGKGYPAAEGPAKPVRGQGWVGYF